ncbi:Hint domain-containing protein [Ketogulonicigenium vulgare]|uniref:Hint domain-containing protein n=1 Tax=Ketogulonicigenium vulgare TaxID=92945 RepID=UPI00235A13B8|nr:Hint domain-containing protein [Ketogulonicigenium vulgare]
MPYLTAVNGAVVNLSLPTPILTLPSTNILNAFGTSTLFSQYNVDGVGDGSTPETVQGGDYLAPIIGGSPVPGTYAGSGTFQTAGLTVGNAILGATVRLNPVGVDYFVDENDQLYIISDAPLDAANLTVTITVNALGTSTPLTLPLTDLLTNPIVAPVLGLLGGPNAVNNILNQVINAQTFDPNGTMTIPPGEINDIVCFVAGTMILTPDGYRMVETLQVGDLVMTKDNGAKPVKWVGVRKLSAAEIIVNQHLRPIRIKAGALGVNTPSQDLMVSPQHRVLVRSKIAQKMIQSDEVLVAAKQLLQLGGIDIATDLTEVEYHHFLFDQHEIVFSNGAETESLYTGAQALKGVGAEARREIFALFPNLLDQEKAPSEARPMLTGRKGRRLAMRHLQANRPLVV